MRSQFFRAKFAHESQGGLLFPGQPGVKNGVSSSAVLHALVLLWGLGSCAARVPVTISADSASSASDANSEDGESDEGCMPLGENEPLPERLQNCSPGTADCDRNPANGCETVLADDAQNCGVCGVQCSALNADSACLGGTCRLLSCAPGYCDSDGEPENGCETAAKTCHP